MFPPQREPFRKAELLLATNRNDGPSGVPTLTQQQPISDEQFGQVSRWSIQGRPLAERQRWVIAQLPPGSFRVVPLDENDLSVFGVCSSLYMIGSPLYTIMQPMMYITIMNMSMDATHCV